jgi:hypothetical protein
VEWVTTYNTHVGLDQDISFAHVVIVELPPQRSMLLVSRASRYRVFANHKGAVRRLAPLISAIWWACVHHQGHIWLCKRRVIQRWRMTHVFAFSLGCFFTETKESKAAKATDSLA